MLTLLLAQDGSTALMLACANEQDAAAGELMEATKRAGALDLQAKDDYRSYKRSALHLASAKTPLDFAYRKTEVARLLEAAGGRGKR